jgi:hypothetical protein
MRDETLLAVAAAYDTAVAAGSARPVEDAAAALNMPMVRARDLVYKARQRGFLTRAGWGRPGGRLTPHGKHLLTAQRRRARRKPR